MKRKQGFSPIEIILTLVVVIIIGAVSYVALSQINKASDDSITPPTKTVTEVPVINSETDLDKTIDNLDATNLDAAEAELTELEAEISNF